MKIEARGLRDNLFIFSLCIIAFIIRFYKLSLFPLNHDEVNWILFSPDHWIKFLGMPVACYEGHVFPFFSYLIAISRQIFDDPVYILRLPAVLVGTITVLLLYKLARVLYDKRVAFLSAGFLAFLPWHIIHSRDGREPILIPFFTCILLLMAVKTLKERRPLFLFIFSFLLAFASFYVYEPALVFIPIFFALALWFQKKLAWVNFRMWSVAGMIFLMTLVPLIYLERTHAINFMNNFTTGQLIFTGDVAHKIVQAIMLNPIILFKSLFVTSKGTLLYGASLGEPLFVNSVFFLLFLGAIITGAYYRKGSDLLLLIFCLVCIVSSLPFIVVFQARYCIHLIVPFLILISAFFLRSWDHMAKSRLKMRRLLQVFFIVVYVVMISTEIVQIFSFYQRGPTDLEECRNNSYGCKEAAEYLSALPDISQHRVIQDVRMTLMAYHREQNFLSGGKDESIRYHVLWAPESHPKECWNGILSWCHECFVEKYGQQVPIYTNYYPNGLSAIQIYRVENNDFVKK
jgi:4-amino-4-deoxy-L-arabinose transferase-like glycosyltransferase